MIGAPRDKRGVDAEILRTAQQTRELVHALDGLYWKPVQAGDLEFSDTAPKIGDDITFSFELNLTIPQKQKVRIEYIVHFVKASGKTSPKVFQIKEVEMKPGKHTINKKHTFKNMTTRKHYPGEHTFEIVINGDVKASAKLQLN